MKGVLGVSDIQAPLNCAKATALVTNVIAELQPPTIAVVGDEADNTQISRWVQGGRESFAGNLQAGLDKAYQVMLDFRQAAPNARIIVQRSNHTTDRIKAYLDRNAPGLATLRELDWFNLMRYGELDIELSMQPTPIAKGWVMMHGDEGGTSRQAGGTALGLARKVGKSVMCGHTHKAGLVHDHDSHSGRITRHLFGMEIGHLMSMRKADVANGGYLKAGSANWQQGIGLLHEVNGRAFPSLIPIIEGRCVVEGQMFE